MTIEQAVPIRSTIPARLDRLGWSPFHTRMVAGLGAAWILDGLQITISSSVTGVLISPETLGMTSTQVGLIASVYLVGEMVRCIDRKRLQQDGAGRGLSDRRGDHGTWRDHRVGLRCQGGGQVSRDGHQAAHRHSGLSSERECRWLTLS